VLGLAWFVGAVAWPLWRTRQVVKHVSATGSGAKSEKDCLEPLGGREAAVLRIRQYLRLPGLAAVDKRSATVILGLCEDPAVPLLLELLRNNDPELRAGAAEALGQIGAAEAVGPVKDACQDPDPSVRDAAKRALAELGLADGLEMRIVGPSRAGPQAGEADLVVEVRNTGRDPVALLKGAFGAEAQGRGATCLVMPPVFDEWRTVRPGAIVEMRLAGVVGAEGYRLQCRGELWTLPPGRYWIRVAYSWQELGTPRVSSHWSGDLRTVRFELEVVGR
jgi:hypothetical protein